MAAVTRLGPLAGSAAAQSCGRGFPQAVEEHGAGQRVARFAFVQPGMHAAAQFYALQPVQDEQRALDAPNSRRATAKPFWRG